MTSEHWQPITGQLLTPWAEKVDPNNPWPEYPRPQMEREHWVNLNGLWDYAIQRRNNPIPVDYDGQILVPFPVESALSGVKRPLKPNQELWYRRTFEFDGHSEEKRLLLHFGAVDWQATVFINGQKIGSHKGGYCPFSFDISNYIKPGKNELVVAVWDPSDKGKQEHGKQVLKPGFIWYTAISGIWQTVWLEEVPQTYIEDIHLIPDIDRSLLEVRVGCANSRPGLTVLARVSLAGNPVTELSFSPDKTCEIQIPGMQLWSPESPTLYDLQITLLDGLQEVDWISSYFGMRKFSLGKDSLGKPRLCLNNEPYFMLGPLDQGYWPDGLYTPPCDEAMRSDIEFCKIAGFNMLRKHVKVEPARFYYHCDRLGIIVWQDMPNGGMTPPAAWFAFQNSAVNRKDDRHYAPLGRSSQSNRQQFEIELKEMVNSLKNSVSLAVWVPFNEGWGQFDARRIGSWLKEYDPSRLIDLTSGWFDQGAGDCRSLHIYFRPLNDIPMDARRATVLSEFGGYQMTISDHAWNNKPMKVYKGYQNSESLTQAYRDLLQLHLLPSIKRGLSAAIYTQTTDVEIELNGYLTYDRQIQKFALDFLNPLHGEIIQASPK